MPTSKEEWIAEAILWLNHLEDEGDHGHLGLREFIADGGKLLEDDDANT